MSLDVEKVVREYLPDVIHMSLATSKDNKPWVCEVHFAFDDGLNLYFRSLTSRRHSQEIAANPAIAGNIVRQFAVGESAVGVYFEGRAEKLDVESEEIQVAYECLKQRFNRNEEILEEAKSPDGHQFYKITVKNWYVFGNLEDKGPQKYHLSWKE